MADRDLAYIPTLIFSTKVLGEANVEKITSRSRNVPSSKNRSKRSSLKISRIE